MMFETLESRRLLSATVTEGYPGFYEIHGGDDDDVIDVNVSMSEETFTLDGATYGGVAFIYVYTYGGNDRVTLNSSDGPGAIGGSVSLGAGNDFVSANFDAGIWGEDGNDVIVLSDAFRGEAHGQAGNDDIYISGYCVDAVISGGDGNDFIDCSGNLTGVVAHGGAGNDTIYGSVYDDQLYGGEGNNVIVQNGGYLYDPNAVNG